LIRSENICDKAAFRINKERACCGVRGLILAALEWHRDPNLRIGRRPLTGGQVLAPRQLLSSVTQRSSNENEPRETTVAPEQIFLHENGSFAVRHGSVRSVRRARGVSLCARQPWDRSSKLFVPEYNPQAAQRLPVEPPSQQMLADHLEQSEKEEMQAGAQAPAKQ
jgi:hypothetical protein